MKAIVYHHYGTPDVLKCEEIEKPTPGDNQLLIRVRAASVNPLECGMILGYKSAVWAIAHRLCRLVSEHGEGRNKEALRYKENR